MIKQKYTEWPHWKTEEFEKVITCSVFFFFFCFFTHNTEKIPLIILANKIIKNLKSTCLWKLFLFYIIRSFSDHPVLLFHCNYIKWKYIAIVLKWRKTADPLVNEVDCEHQVIKHQLAISERGARKMEKSGGASEERWKMSENTRR